MCLVCYYTSFSLMGISVLYFCPLFPLLSPFFVLTGKGEKKDYMEQSMELQKELDTTKKKF